MELNGDAYRRHLGFDKDDAPTDEEITSQALKIILRNFQNEAPAALDALVGKKVLVEPSPAVTGTPGGPPNGGNTPPGGEEPPPEDATQGDTGPANGGKAPTKPTGSKATPASVERLAQAASQLAALHLIKFNKTQKTVTLMHPPVCNDHAFSCPFTHAMYERLPSTLSTGTYECRLGLDGLQVGEQAPQRDDGSWIEITKKITPVRRAPRGRSKV
jgi:hypothetical protein